jgi:hypothetical protein
LLIALGSIMAELLIRENFLTAQDCRSFIACYEDNRPNLRQDTSDYWKDRVLYFTAMPEQHRAIKLRMRDLVYEQIQVLHQHFAYSGPLYPETVNLVSWPQNLEMTPHVDQDNGFDQRMFAAVDISMTITRAARSFSRRSMRASSPRRECWSRSIAGQGIAMACGPQREGCATPSRRGSPNGPTGSTARSPITVDGFCLA